MNIEQAFETQLKTDEAITANLPAHIENMEDWKCLQDRKFAFRVEVMELANEVGFFKYWKHSHKVDKARVLDELADCIAFALSIGLTQGYQKLVKEVEPFGMWEDYYIDDMFDMLTDIDLSNMGKFQLAFSLLVGIGLKMGATETEILEAYYKKSKENLERQAKGY